jgi:phage terminase small subunit
MTLTASKEKFAQHYATSRDASAAYRHAYNVRSDTKETTANVQGSKLLADPNIRQRVEEIIAAATVTSESVMDLAKIQDMWASIAAASPDELIGLRVGCCRYCWGFEHKYQWREREYLEALTQAERIAKTDPDCPLPDPSGGLDFNHTTAPNDACPECRGEGVERVVARDTSKLSPGAKLLYGGLKKKRDGLEIIIASREKALENLTRMQGGYKDNVKVDGSIKAAAALVKLQTTDPNEAAKAYADFIANTMAV